MKSSRCSPTTMQPKVKAIIEWAEGRGPRKDVTQEALVLAGFGQLSDADIEKKITEMRMRLARLATSNAPMSSRAELITAGILIENTKEGVRWRRK